MLGDGEAMQAEDDDAGGGEFVGARLDAGLRAARFASPPSADEFAAAVEPRNAPAVESLASPRPESSRSSPLPFPSLLPLLPFLLPSVVDTTPCYVLPVRCFVAW